MPKKVDQNGLGRQVPEWGQFYQRYAATLPNKTIRSPFFGEDEEGCWIWTGEMSKGYPVQYLYHEGRRYRFQATRIFWAMRRRRWPSPKSDIHHTCGNPECVNPKHLVTAKVEEHRGSHVYSCNEDVE